MVVLQLTSDTTAVQALKATVVHALLMQDVIGSVSVNGTFWSIAVEWHIYLVFPVMLVLVRRGGGWLAASATTSAVLLAYLASSRVPMGEKVLHLSPQMYALFALGVLAAKATTVPLGRRAGAAMSAAAVLLSAALTIAASLRGSVWMVDHYFWVDLVFGAAVAAAFAAVSSGRLAVLRRVLRVRLLTFLGAFAYSLYLVQAPVLELVPHLGIEPAALSPLGRLVLWATLVPVVCGVSWLFHLVFERPFLLVRGAGGFRHVPGLRRWLSEPLPVPAPRKPSDDVDVRAGDVGEERRLGTSWVTRRDSGASRP